MQPNKDAKFKICPQCGDKILAEGTRDECDECEVPYVLEVDLNAWKAKQEAEAKAKAEARANAEAELEKAEQALEEARAKLID